ncbi:hypothetical protein BDZ45DRAFT_753307 [Acephala macrosclerotiorum]|nr:hypothetical protein BDZ45DRAFT_753307 [Acephala macrosclerotiorum]
MNPEATTGETGPQPMIGWGAIRQEVAAMKQRMRQNVNNPSTSTARSISVLVDSATRYSALQNDENRPLAKQSSPAKNLTVQAISNESSASLKPLPKLQSKPPSEAVHVGSYCTPSNPNTPEAPAGSYYKKNPMWRKINTRRMFGVQENGLPHFSVLTTFERPFQMPLYCGNHPGNNWAEQLQTVFGVQLLCTSDSNVGQKFVVYAEPFLEDEGRATSSDIIEKYKSKSELRTMVWRGYNLKEFYDLWAGTKQHRFHVQEEASPPKAKHAFIPGEISISYEPNNDKHPMFLEYAAPRLLPLQSNGLP